MKPIFRLRLPFLALAILLPGFAAQRSPQAGAPVDKPVADPIARIEGDDISVHGDVSLERETGRSFAELSSGTEVNVRSGRARIELRGGGEIGVCGPAKFSLLRSGAALTVALDFGRIHARLNESQPVTVFTPLAVATPVPISGGTDELHLGLEQTGKMCLYAARGAVRVQPQFGDEAVVIPQNVEASFTEGRLDAVAQASHTCTCDALAAFAAQRPPAVRIEPSVLPAGDRSDGANPAQVPAKDSEPPAAVAKPATEEPIWKVQMPVLSFDATAPAAAPPRPETILLFREVQVQHGAQFHGSVAPRLPASPTAAANAADKPANVNGTSQPAKKPSFGARIRNFFRRMFGGKPNKN
jgi:hypothetical protein